MTVALTKFRCQATVIRYSDPQAFSPEDEEIPMPPPCGLLIGIYIFYENWSTETSRKEC